MATWQLTIDANDPARLAAFWAQVLEYEPAPPPPGLPSWRAWYLSVGVPEEELADVDDEFCDRLIDPHGHGPKIWFQIVPETKAGKNRLHLDIFPSGGRGEAMALRRERVDAKVAELVAAGATVVRRVPGEGEEPVEGGPYSATMQDPEGNEFCVA